MNRDSRVLRLVGAVLGAYDGLRSLVAVRRIRYWEVPEYSGRPDKKTGGNGIVAVAETRGPDWAGDGMSIRLAAMAAKKGR